MAERSWKWKCNECGSLVSELSECPLCQSRKLLCDQCLDPFVGACKDCVKELFKGDMKCRICGLTRRTSDLKTCSFCRRMVCIEHFSDGFPADWCDECIESDVREMLSDDEDIEDDDHVEEDEEDLEEEREWGEDLPHGYEEYKYPQDDQTIYDPEEREREKSWRSCDIFYGWG